MVLEWWTLGTLPNKGHVRGYLLYPSLGMLSVMNNPLFLFFLSLCLCFNSIRLCQYLFPVVLRLSLCSPFALCLLYLDMTHSDLTFNLQTSDDSLNESSLHLDHVLRFFLTHAFLSWQQLDISCNMRWWFSFHFRFITYMTFTLIVSGTWGYMLPFISVSFWSDMRPPCSFHTCIILMFYTCSPCFIHEDFGI